jgi:hypothetical protein
MVGIVAVKLTGVLVGSGVGVGGTSASAVMGVAGATAGVDVSAGLGVGTKTVEGGTAAWNVSGALVAAGGGKIKPRANRPKAPRHTINRSAPATTPIRDILGPLDLATGALGVIT